jgi:hypothetical protein
VTIAEPGPRGKAKALSGPDLFSLIFGIKKGILD